MDKNKEKICLFDFDGTLTRRDSLLRIVLRVSPIWKVAAALLLLVPMLVAARLGVMRSGRAKERLLSFCFGGMDAGQFGELCRRFAAEDQWIWRPRAVAELSRLRSEGTRCVVVTASVDLWVRPFLDKVFPEMELIATQMEVNGGRLTGRFATPNCRGDEKVRRIGELIPAASREHYYICAYGDSGGDSAMLAYSDEPHYRAFE